jgi:hypothetical protein
MYNDVERIWKEEIMAQCSYCPGIPLEELKETT